MNCIYCHKKVRSYSDTTHGCKSCQVTYYRYKPKDFSVICFYFTNHDSCRCLVEIIAHDDKVRFLHLHPTKDNPLERTIGFTNLSWIFPENFKQKFNSWQKTLNFK